MCKSNRNFIKGIIIKKIRYRDYHEILHVLTEHGKIESFFYENVHKSKKKVKVSTASEVTINFFSTSGMNKITNLEIENTYQNIVYDVLKNSYVANMLECLNYGIDSSFNLYKLLKDHGFIFKYQKTDYEYVGYSFLKNSFVDKFNIDYSVFGINDNLVKLTYYISTKNIDFLEGLELSNKDLIKLFSFFNLLFIEYIVIENK